VITIFEKMRRNSEQKRRIYREAAKLGKDLNGREFELSTPRLSKRQVHHANSDSQSTEHYYVTLFNEFLSHIISDLQQRFLDSPAYGLNHQRSFQINPKHFQKVATEF